MFLRREKQVRGDEWWGFVLFGVALIGISVLGLTGAFGELDSTRRLRTLVLIGIPLGAVVLVIGVVKLFRTDRPAPPPPDPDAEPPGPDAARPGDADRPHGPIDR